MLDHLPPQLHLVIATRADPPLPLARLRARGGWSRCGPSDLRFTADEAATYLNGSMGLALSDADVATLDERTEGWVAALQLAALSLQGRDDPSAFIASSPATTASSSTTWPTRCSPDRALRYATSCSRRRSSSGSPARSATPSPGVRTAGPRWSRSSEPTSSSSRSTTGGSGGATTTCSPTCCGPTCTTSGPDADRRAAPTGQRLVRGSMATSRRRSATRWPAVTYVAPRTSWSSRCR